MSVKSPAFQFYPHDFLAGRVATYSLEEVGAYITLLGFDWTLNGLPKSLEKLAKICRVSSRRFEKIWQTIGDQFVENGDGKLHNPRLQGEREKQLAYSASMSENGRRGGRPRKPDESRGLAAVKPDESSPSPTPSPTNNKKQRTAASADESRVLEHYRTAHPKRRTTDKSVRIVRNALSLGYSPDELCEAITGNASSQWHIDNRKHELSYVLRDEEHIDGFRLNAEPMQPIVDDYGCLTPYGERLTRPANV